MYNKSNRIYRIKKERIICIERYFSNRISNFHNRRICKCCIIICQTAEERAVFERLAAHNRDIIKISESYDSWEDAVKNLGSSKYISDLIAKLILKQEKEIFLHSEYVINFSSWFDDSVILEKAICNILYNSS